MPDRTADEKLDPATSREVARGIGENLRQSLGADARCPDRLQRLLDALRDREAREGADDTPS